MYIEPINVDEEIDECVAKTVYELSVLFDSGVCETIESDIENIFKENNLTDKQKQQVFRIRYSAPLPFITQIEVNHMKEVCGYNQ